LTYVNARIPGTTASNMFRTASDVHHHTRLHSIDLRQLPAQVRSQSRPNIIPREGRAMLRYILAALAALVLFTVCIIPDDAYARRGGGGGFRGGGGGFHGGGMRGGGMHAGRIHGGRVHAGRIHGGGRYAGRIRPSHPIAGRPIAGYPGRPIAGRPGRPIAGYPGGGYYRPGLGYGAAAVGAAAAYGAYGGYGYSGNYGCYYDQYGRYVCPQYPYQGYYQ
jgi:hypothetical protein